MKVPVLPTPSLDEGERGEREREGECVSDSLAEDSDCSVARVHLSFSDHVQHLNNRPSGGWPPVLWPVLQLELCDHHTLSLTPLHSLCGGVCAS